jgi:hypothetical protein
MGEEFMKNSNHYKNLFGIVMLCIDQYINKKGLAKKLIDKHFQIANNKKYYVYIQEKIILMHIICIKKWVISI